MDKGTRVISVFIPHEGCPHDCVFCNQKKISGTVSSPSTQDMINTIEAALETIDANKYHILLAFYGGSFTAIEKHKQMEYLKIAKQYKDQKKIGGIRLSTRPDYMGEEQVLLLKEYTVDHVELGIQSTCEEALALTKRYYSMDHIRDAVRNLNQYGLDFGFQIMLGLPGDTRESMTQTCLDLLPFNPSTLRIYPTLVIKGTELEEMYKRGEYTPLTLNEAIEQSVIPTILFEKNHCNIIRVGLHASESLLFEDNIIAGPFHSSFGEMVQSRIYWYMLKEAVEKHSLQNKPIEIAANKRDFSKITGNKGENRQRLKEQYHVEYKFREDNTLKEDVMIIYKENTYLVRKNDFYETF